MPIVDGGYMSMGGDELG